MAQPMSIQDRVLKAVREGAETSRDVEAMTDLPFRLVSGTLSNLFAKGFIQRTGEIRYPGCPRTNWKYVAISKLSSMNRSQEAQR